MLVRIAVISAALFVVASAEDRFIGDTNATLSQAYVVSIRYVNGLHICSGLSYAPSHVVTTAQCLRGITIDRLTIYANGVIGDNLVMFKVFSMAIHPQFNAANLNYDIAVLTVGAVPPTVLTRTVGPIAVAIKPNSAFTVIGWSRNGQNFRLQRYNANYIMPTLCRKFFVMTGTMICTTSQTLGDTCPGDEGSVLIQGGAAVGIVSRKVGCQDLKPTLYTYFAEPLICNFLNGATLPSPPSPRCNPFVIPDVGS